MPVSRAYQECLRANKGRIKGPAMQLQKFNKGELNVRARACRVHVIMITGDINTFKSA